MKSWKLKCRGVQRKWKIEPLLRFMWWTKVMTCSGLPEERATVLGLRGVLQEVHSQFCWPGRTTGFLDRKGRPIRLATGLRDGIYWIAWRSRRAPILLFPTEHGDYILDTDASNFGLGGVLSQIQDNVERVIVYCSRAVEFIVFKDSVALILG